MTDEGRVVYNCRMLFRLLLLFTVIPMAELWLLLWIAGRTSWQATIVLVLVTGIVGAWLARWQGWLTVRRIQAELAGGRMPTESLLDGLLILVAGAVLVTPGVLTDTVGFLLLIPACRRLVKAWLKRRFQASFTVYASRSGDDHWSTGPDDSFDRDRVIDARVIDAKPPNEEDNAT